MPTSDNFLANRHHVTRLGPASAQSEQPTLVLSHGFGCDQQIWSPVAQLLARDFPVVLFDHMGCGRSDMRAYDPERYTNLDAYADDLAALVTELELDRPILVGHSVSGAIGWLASIGRPELFQQVIAIGPSPRYINDPPDYEGGFEEQDVQDLIDLMERNYFEWAGYLAPVAIGNDAPQAVTDALRQSFLDADPEVSRRFARSTFMSDIRARLQGVTVPTLILYSEEDVIVPAGVIDYLASALPDCQTRKLNATGHYPHMTHPQEVADAIREGIVLEA
ncbi:MAG: alpha/beta hydrolase [Gammaproteobacteria bacterium]|nr:alpha/beta hydrolase [Gammaproteobacteria bacterium]